MAFTTFIDDLALVEVLLLLVATLFAYAGVMVWWAVRSNDPKAVRGVLRGLAVPAGGLGAVTLTLALWGEMTWPFLASDQLAGYNIFFFDPMVLLGLVLVAYSVSAHISAKMQYVGLLALVSGSVTLFYGYTGYTASPAFTKDPFDTFLLYAGFAAAGIFAFPASIVVDYFLRSSEAGSVPFLAARTGGTRGTTKLGQRAVQPVAPGLVPADRPAAVPEEAGGAYECPALAQGLILLFPLFAALASIAALWYFGTTLPGHLGAGAGAAP